MRFIHTAAVKSEGQLAAAVAGGRSIVVFAASLTQFGKSQISHQSRYQALQGLGMPASGGGRVTAEEERLNISSGRRLPDCKWRDQGDLEFGN